MIDLASKIEFEMMFLMLMSGLICIFELFQLFNHLLLFLFEISFGIHIFERYLILFFKPILLHAEHKKLYH